MIEVTGAPPIRQTSTWPIRLYGTVMDVAERPLAWLLRRRLGKGKEDPARLGERMGVPGQARPKGRLVWIHAASVGESLSVLPLIARLGEDHPGTTILVTTTTVTSASLMAERLPDHVIHQFIPLDRPRWNRAFLDHWRPDLALIVESELWPSLLAEIRIRAVPAGLINARMSERSFRRWQRVPATAGFLLGTFQIALAQTDEEAARLKALGAVAVAAVGNLKQAGAALPVDADYLASLKAAIGERPVWVMASSHPGEEDIALRVHAALAGRHPDLLTIIVPRHPPRGDDIATLVDVHGLTLSRRSTGGLPGGDRAIFLADTMGELGTLFRASDLAVIGGSFVPVGGHNPLEPARLGCAIVHGPHMFNFAEISRDLAAAGGAIAVPDTHALTSTIDRLLADRPAREALANASRSAACGKQAALDAVMHHLAPLFTSAGLHPAEWAPDDLEPPT